MESRNLRRGLFLVLMAGFVGSWLGAEFYGLHYGFILIPLALGFMAGLTIWSIVFLKSEPNLTRIVLIIVLVYLAILLLIGLGSGGA